VKIKVKDYREYGEIVLDASAVPKGSNINIVTMINSEAIVPKNVDVTKIEEQIVPKGISMDVVAMKNITSADFILKYDKRELSDFNGDKLVISYSLYQTRIVDDYNITPFMNPRVSARLSNTALTIDCTYDKNVKAVFLPVWSFMRQFDRYKGKDFIHEKFRRSQIREFRRYQISQSFDLGDVSIKSE
jgi:hypothetical protein